MRKFLNLAPTLFLSRSLVRLRSSIITYATRIALAPIQNVLRILLSIHLSIDINSGPVHTKTIVNANAGKRKRFYAFRPSVHTKTMKTLNVNA